MVKITDAEDLFEPHIYHRGEAISCTDAVKITHKSSNLITAVVEGTDYYDVRIVMKSNSISSMSCTCPYADTGENCKHMAAVLIYCFDDSGISDGEDGEKSILLLNVYLQII